MADSRSLSLLLRLMEPTRRVTRRLREVAGVEANGDADLPLSDWYALGAVALVIGEGDVALSVSEWREAWLRLAQLVAEHGPDDVLLRVGGGEYAVGTFDDIGDAARSNRAADGSYAYIHEVSLSPLVKTLDQQAARGG